uniref:Chemosensory protein 3 n=1 Tax=Yemma signatus TaxID=300820 RepID=A0A3G2GRR8_9HEMI|nr:chemosensory protein 3 [Yemma signatus]
MWPVAHLLAAAVVVLATPALAAQNYQDMDEETLYRFIFDDVDIDHIILNDRICDVYLRCFFNTGPCTNLAAAIRSKIPEVFETVCGKCTLKQKKIWKHAMDLFIPRRPKEWERLLSIYDPEGKFWPNIKVFRETPLPDGE